MALTFGAPRQEEYEAIATIVTDAFADSSRAFFGERCPELLAFRVSLIRQRDDLMQLYQQGKVATRHQILVARDPARAGAVIGVAIWSLEDDWSAEGVKQRAEEMKMAIPMAALPASTNMPLYDKCQVDFARMQKECMQDRPRCCEYSSPSFLTPIDLLEPRKRHTY